MGRLTQDLRAAGIDFDAKKLRPLRKKFGTEYGLEYSSEFENGIFLVCYGGVAVAYIDNGKLMRVPGIKVGYDVHIRRINWTFNKNVGAIGTFWVGLSHLIYWIDAPHISVECPHITCGHCRVTTTKKYMKQDDHIWQSAYEIMVQNLLEKYHTPFIEEVVAREIVRAQLPGPIADEITECINAVIARRLYGYNHYKIYAWNSRECFIQETIKTVQGRVAPEIRKSDTILQKDARFAQVESWEDGVEFIRANYAILH